MNNRIKQLRKTLNLTQQEFAERIGIKRNTIANYEGGRNEPVSSVINLICREYNVNIDWLRTGDGDMFVEKSKDEEIAEMLADIQRGGEDTFKHRLVSALAKLDESDWERLEKLIDLISEKKDAPN